MSSRPLTIPTYDHLQTTLFPIPDAKAEQELSSIGQARGIVGAFFEEATRLLTDAYPMHLQSGHLCPDLMVQIDACRRHYLEIKGCGRGRQIILFDHSIEAYHEFCFKAYPEKVLTFLWWFHKTETGQYDNVGDLRRSLANNIDCCLALDFWDVYNFLQGEPVRPININSSTGRRDLTGWRFSWTELMALADPEPLVGCCPPVFGHNTSSFSVYRSPTVASYNHWSFPW